MEYLIEENLLAEDLLVDDAFIDDSFEIDITNKLFIEKILQSLSDEDAELIKRHAILGETLRELSASFGVTAETLFCRIKNIKNVLVKRYGAPQ